MRSYRCERVSDLLLGFLAEEIGRFRDPRLEFVTLTGVKVTPDLKTARVFWTAVTSRFLGEVADKPAGSDDPIAEFPSAEEVEAVGSALAKAAGLLQRRISEELDLRYTPHLVFQYDESLLSGSRIDYLLKKAQAEK